MDPTIFEQKLARDLRTSRVKLGIWAFAFVVLLIYMLRNLPTRGKGGGDEQEAIAPQGAGQPSAIEGVSPVLPKASPEIAVKEEEPGNEPLPRSEDDLLKEIQDRSPVLEPRPFFSLLARVTKDDPQALKDKAKPVADWAVLWDQPGKHRGQPVVARGAIIRIWRQPLGTNPAGIKELWAYRLHVEGAPPNDPGCLFDVYSIEKLHGAITYDQVTAYGRFLKAQTLEAEHIGDPDFRTAVVLARRIEPVPYLDAPDPPGPITQDGRAEARLIYYFLKRAQTTSFSRAEAAATDKLTLVDLVGHPEQHIGKIVTVRGELRRCHRTTLDENPLHLDHVYYGQITDNSGATNTYYCLNIPEGLRIRDGVLLYGYFLKKWTYVSQGDRMVTSPIFVGERLIRLVRTPDYTLQIILVSVLALTAGVFVFCFRRDRAKTLALAAVRRQAELERAAENLRELTRKAWQCSPEGERCGPASGNGQTGGNGAPQ